jgi:hypothetical protein
MSIMIERDDVGWITSRISEDVDRGLITADINIRKSSLSCELDIALRTVSDIMNKPALQTAMGASLTLLIKEIKDGLIRRRKEKIMKDKRIAGVS